MPVYKLHIKRTVIFAVLGILVALVVGYFSPKVFEGRMQIMVGTNAIPNPAGAQLTPDVWEILNAGLQKDTQSELDVLRGEGVFDEALQRVSDRTGKPVSKNERERLYLMYDVLSTKDTSVALVRVRADDPQFSSDVANEVGNVYNDLRKRSAQAAVRNAQNYLENQVVDSKKSLDASQAKLEAYKSEHRIVDTAVENARSTEERTALNQALQSALADVKSFEAEAETDKLMLANAKRTYNASSTSIKNPVVQQLEIDRAELISKKDMARTQYLDDSLQVREIDQQIKSIDQRLKAEKNATVVQQGVQAEAPIYEALQQMLAQANAKLDASKKRADSLQVSLAGTDQRATLIPPAEAEINKLETDRQINDLKYRRVKSEADDLKFKTEAAAMAAQILYSSVPDDEPVAPIFSKLALIGMFAGICVGLLYSYTLEAMKLRVYTSSQLTELTGLPVLASAPTLPKAQARKLQRSLSSGKPALLESFRFMAFSMLADGKESPRSVLFTGVGGSVGCSTAAAQYAIAAAKTGAKVALVDYDFQDSTITRLFNMENRPGVKDILSRTMLPGESADLTFETSQPNLRVVPIGTESGINVSDVPFQHLGGLIANLAKEVDIVVIDSAPVDRLSDASRLVPYVDEVCLVVSAATTSYRHIPIAQEILRRAGAKEVGLVLTGANQQEEPFSSESPFFAERGVG